MKGQSRVEREIDCAITEASRRVVRQRGNIIRSLRFGIDWRSEQVQRFLDELRLALADHALACNLRAALLVEADAEDARRAIGNARGPL